VTGIGLLVAVVGVWLVSWELAVIAGWDAAAFSFLLTVWPIILRPTAPRPRGWPPARTRAVARRRCCWWASVASLLGAGFVLNLAGQDSGPPRVLFIGVAVALSWTVVNTVYALRCAD
jgi:uncharacterized membrane protein